MASCIRVYATHVHHARSRPSHWSGGSRSVRCGRVANLAGGDAARFGSYGDRRRHGAGRGKRWSRPGTGCQAPGGANAETRPEHAPSQVLGVLPQVGPALVRELVSARNERPLTSLEDARSRVRGLGPAISDQIAPYLRFEPAAGSRADEVTSSPGDRTVKKPRATKRKKPRSQPPAPAPTHLVAQSTVPGVE